MNNPITDFLNEVETKVLAQGTDVVSMIKTDHRKVEGLFNDFQSQTEDGEKINLAKSIINELTVHAAAEESKVYPVLDKEDHGGFLESLEEHDLMKKLLGELRGMNSIDAKFEAKMKVLFELVKHHVKEEEDKYLPELSKSDKDLDELGEAFSAEKERIFHEPMKNGLVPDQDGGAGSSKKGRRSSSKSGSKTSKTAAMKKRSSTGKSESKSAVKKSSKSAAGRKGGASRKVAAVAKKAKTGAKKAKAGAKKSTGAGGKKSASARKSTSARKNGSAKKSTSDNGRKSATARKTTSTRKSAGTSKSRGHNVRSIKQAPKRKAS